MSDAASTDATLADHHVPDLSWRQQQAAVGCACLQTDEEMAEALFLTEATVRRHIAEAIHRVFDPLELEGSRTLLGRWCGHHWDCCVQTRTDQGDQKFSQGDQPRPRFPHIRWIRRRGRRRNHESGNSNDDHPLHGAGRWNGRWHGLALAGSVVAIGLLVGFGIAHATFVSDSDSNTHNGCYYSGYSSYDTNSVPYGYSQTYSSNGGLPPPTCAAFSALSAYFWYPPINDFIPATSGWVHVTLIDARYEVAVTQNVYGYHQIRQPSSSWSTTLETHAQ